MSDLLPYDNSNTLHNSNPICRGRQKFPRGVLSLIDCEIESMFTAVERIDVVVVKARTVFSTHT